MARRAGIRALVLTLVVITGACGPADVAGVTESRPTAMMSTAPSDEASPRPVLRDELARLVETDDRVLVVDGAARNTEVELRADAADLARQLQAAYGEQINLYVGGWPYPPSNIPDDIDGCPQPATAPWPSGVTATLELDDHAIPEGGGTHGVVTVTNGSDERFVVDVTGFTLGLVYDVGDRSDPVGHPGSVAETTSGSASEPGPRRTLDPGDSTRFGAPVGTTSCHPKDGYAVAVGTYDVRVLIEAGPNQPARLSAPARLDITRR